MLDGKCGKVSIGDEICMHARGREKFAEYLAMTLTGLRNPHSLGREPGEHLPPRFRNRRGPFEHTWIGSQSQECKQARPWQANRSYAVKACVEPCTGARVLGKSTDVRVDQQIGVNQYHRKDSPSTVARTSETLSILPARQRPRDTARVRGTRRAGGGDAICPRPWRRASFTTAFKLALRVLRSRSSAIATSFSRVRVVLMHQSIREVMR